MLNSFRLPYDLTSSLPTYYRIAGNFRWCKLSEEIFVVLSFASPSARRAIVWCTYAAYSKFRGSYFRGGRPIREKREILHQAKISRYTVFHISTYT